MLKAPTPRQAVAMVRIDGKWSVQMLTLDNDRVTKRDVIETTYHRDLAEDAARRTVLKLER